MEVERKEVTKLIREFWCNAIYVTEKGWHVELEEVVAGVLHIPIDMLGILMNINDNMELFI